MAKLYFKYGAMGSSKSAQALITQFNYEELGMSVWLIKPSIDTRDGADIIRSRIGLERRARVITPEQDIREEYKPFFIKQEADRQLWKFVKAADKICAYTKCIEESKAGNHDFDKAAKTNLKGLEALDMPEVKCFMEDFLPSYSLTLDEMN